MTRVKAAIGASLIALALCVSACSDSSSEEKAETKQQRQERILAEYERNQKLDVVLPRTKSLPATTDIQLRIGADWNGHTPTCQYVREGLVLLQDHDGKIFRIARTDAEHYGKSSWSYESYYLDTYWATPEEGQVKLTLEEADNTRWANFTEVLCPEDGQRYAEAWMKYRFPGIKS
jgi:hypothetical protein